MLRCVPDHRAAALVALLTVAGCSSEGAQNRYADPADVNAAAAAAQDDIDAYAANRATPRALPSATATPPATPSATPTEPAGDAIVADAVAIVRGYHDAIAAGRYVVAYRLWDDDGQASGMTARQFADSFAKYASYRAELGPPGRVDAGAGQRYIEIPVRVSGTLVDGGRPFVLRGPMTLHRTGPIDGATAEQRSWRISASALRPRPDEAAAD